MERIERIEPFKYRKDGEYQPYYNFLKDSLSLLDIQIPEKKIDEQIRDIAYDSLTTIIKFGTQNYGLEVYKRIEYKQIAHEIAADIIKIRTYGLEKRKSLEIKSIRENITQFLELQINFSGVESDIIATKFYETFYHKPIEENELVNELLILKTLLKRKAWSTVELRSKSILKKHKNHSFAKFAYALVLASEGDFEESEKLIKEVLLRNPNFEIGIYNLALIFIKMQDYASALELLLDVIESKQEHHAAYYHIGLIYEEQDNLEKAFNAYHNTIKYSPKPDIFSFLKDDFTSEARDRIREIRKVLA